MRLWVLLLWFMVLVCQFVCAQAPWKFIITGDSRGGNNGVNTTILNEIAAEIVSHQVDFVLFPGDLVTGSTTQSTLQSQLTTWRNCMQPVYNAGIKVYPVRGNHDKGNLAAWNNVFSGSYAMPQNGPSGETNLTYSVTHKNALVLALDQYVNANRVNQTWVNNQLAGNTKPHVFALGHEPAFKVDHADCLDEYATQRNTFWTSLKNAGCKVYACGHDHFYDHVIVEDGDGNPNNNIHQYLVGTAGAPLRGYAPAYDGVNSGYVPQQWHHCEQFGYLLVEVLDDTSLYMVWYERDPVTASYMPLYGSVDLQTDGVINGMDLLAMVDQWLQGDCRVSNLFCGGADVDRSTKVDFDDLGYLSADWQKTVPIVKEFQVSISTDDAEQNVSTGAIDVISTDLELIRDTADQVVGIRFTNVTIPQSAQIANAYIQFTCDTATNTNPCSLMIYAQNVDHAASFTTGPGTISSRLRTAGIAWSPPNWSNVLRAGTAERTPNLASIVQAIVNRSGWQSGNAIAFIITGTGKRMAVSWDEEPPLSPKLHVELE